MTAIASSDMQTDSALPAGWKWARLGEVCETIRGITFRSGDASDLQRQGDVAYLTTSGVQEVTDWESRRYISASLVKRPEQFLRTGDILVSTANSKELVGKSCLITDIPEPCSFGAFVTVVRPLEQVSSRYISYSLRSFNAKQYFFDCSSYTTNISNLRTTDLLDLPIPLPPLDEQERIARILDECLALVARAKDAAEAQLEAAVALPGAYLRQALPAEGDDLPAGWRWARLGEVADVIAGQSPPGTSYNDDGIGVPFYQGKKEFGDIFIGEPMKWTTDPRRFADEDDILMSVRAPVGPVNLATQRICVGRGLAIIRPVQDRLATWYAFYFLQSMESDITGNVGSIFASINKRDIEAILIPLPPLDEQRRIASDLDARISVAGTLVSRIRAQLEAIDALPGAYLRQAFAGEI